MTRQIEGRNAVIEALNSKTKIEEIYVQKDIDDPKINQILKYRFAKLVPKHELDKMSKTRRHQGVIAIATDKEKIKLKPFIENIYDRKENPLIVVLSGAVYEHNLGTVLRSAECFGAHLVIIPKNTFGLTANVTKASAGASEHIPVLQTDLFQGLKELQQLGLKIIGLNEKSKTKLQNSKLNLPLAIIVGAEDKGINENFNKYIDEFLKIKMTGKINSLNMAAAASVCLYEVSRQKG
jgi:23S rRNA (guanosine2251-2'-O)-methyltransferase